MGLDVQSTIAVGVDPKRPSTIYYGWINLVLAALAMTATLPARTHGLGLITAELTADPLLDVDDKSLSIMNFWAVVIGSALCLPVGRMIDRFGVRGVLVGVAVGLGLAVIGMSTATGVVILFVTLTLVRGLGQGALSVVSMAMIGKWFTRRLPIAMAVFTVLLAFGFLAANFAVGLPVREYGWRPAWRGVGLFMLIVLAPLGALFVRSTPEAVGISIETDSSPSPAQPSSGVMLGAALKSPAFWAFTIATSLFNLVWSALTFFSASVLQERGFGEEMNVVVLGTLMFSGLPANLICGWLAQRWPMGRLLGIGMLALAAAMAIFPRLTETWQVVLYAAALGVSGGIITVIFFAVYGHAFGRRHLGAIQGTVQIVTVFASAIGPVMLQWIKAEAGNYGPFFYVMALASIVLGVAVWIVPLSKASGAE